MTRRLDVIGNFFLVQQLLKAGSRPALPWRKASDKPDDQATEIDRKRGPATLRQAVGAARVLFLNAMADLPVPICRSGSWFDSNTNPNAVERASGAARSSVRALRTSLSALFSAGAIGIVSGL
ncbi:hypothetical protein EPA93_27445 [Ktedonosporobacter rubrisoli]|uniref:Uncharacterized protein n=1 Tax=Ktedonosporobacter rubrisoli TaxID=2509675 RepID=A0A4P6JVV1_KTERU|nr:hypothetical protein [Ktedonosporobacter rubrisoli]QBD79513.1 hypothetical protein EPA93_27445 [Ktedonosporobacter rubrisoli]